MRLTIFVLVIELCYASSSSSSKSREDDGSNERVKPPSSPEWYYQPRRPQSHRLNRYRPHFYPPPQSNEQEYQSGYRQPSSYRQPERHDPYGDPYAYAKHVSSSFL